MYTFLCQVDKRINHDFVLATMNAIDFANWYNGENVFESIMIENVDNVRIANGDKTIVPVGSVEFVHEFYKKFWNIDNLKPINIPIQLLKYAERKVWYGNETELIEKETFCKSADKIKSFTDIIDSKTQLPKGLYMFSELIDIESEYRCFVLRGELLAIHNYNNTLGPYPDICKIKEMVSQYKDLDAYTLDIGVNSKQGTFIIEVHDFYSCGLYGFSNHSKLTQMLLASHLQKLSQI